LLPVLGLFTLARIIFTWYNRSLLAVTGFPDFVKIIYAGLQQDVSSILLLNAPVLLLLFIYDYLRPQRNYLKIVQWLFVLINATGLAMNIFDTGYFGFVKHRMNPELLYILEDSLTSFKAVLSGFWILLLVFVLIVAVLVKISSSIIKPPIDRITFLPLVGGQLLLIFVFALAARGFRARIISPFTPLISVQPSQLPAAQNSVLTMFYSFLKRPYEVKPYRFFTDKEANAIVPTSYYIGNPDSPFRKKNVVLFILESFSRGYLLNGHPNRAKTPFLDSLLQKSIFFPHAIANNYVSAHGIVSILGSIPTLLDEPLFLSQYANLNIQGIGNALKQKGYHTSFFMGAGSDHFSFGKFTHMVGIDDYYSKEDFNNNDYYDGNWGIYDAPFFSYGADVLHNKRQPFLSVFFNLSSHYPFTIPKELKNKFNDPSQLPAQRSISYVDYSLQQFFGKIENEPWFQNTVFLFCADHWFPAELTKMKYDYVNASAISFFIYDPSKNSGSVIDKVVDQTDIVPTVLDLLNYNDVYHGFGKSVFDSTASRYVINKYQQYYYQCISDKHVLGVDPSTFQTKYLFSYAGDSITSPNLMNVDSLAPLRSKQERYIKAYLQQYHKTLINRRF
jgi:phosphoglycerol transferase MdoB-like AlkP superfamily enzyme